jgi:hypothetical protein
VHRTRLDRWLSLFAPHYRYKCSACGWTGLLRAEAEREGAG